MQPGLPELVATLKDMQTREHAPPYQDWDLVVTTGSQDGICRAFEMLLTPDDTLVVEVSLRGAGASASFGVFSPLVSRRARPTLVS
jgi:kynurenine/2-aminoadipate aminotransferase